jgi:PTS system ascorbate-specific IIB component
MKIMAVCSSGLGSSFMLELNIKKVLAALNIKDIQVEHSDLSSLTKGCADIFVATRDISPQCEPFGRVVSLRNILDKAEMQERLKIAIDEIEMTVS